MTNFNLNYKNFQKNIEKWRQKKWKERVQFGMLDHGFGIFCVLG